MKLFILIYDYCYPHDIKSDNIIAQNIRIFQESKKERLNRFNFKKKTPSFSLSLSLKLLFTMEISSRTCLSQLFLLSFLPPSTSSIIVTKASVQVYNDEGWKRIATWTPSSPRREKLLYATFVSHRTLHVTSVIDRGFKAWPPWCTRFSPSVCVYYYTQMGWHFRFCTIKVTLFPSVIFFRWRGASLFPSLGLENWIIFEFSFLLREYYLLA